MYQRLATLLFALLLLVTAPAVRADSPRVEEGVFHATRQAIEVAPTGLPAGITIHATPEELPLERRAAPEDVSDAFLRGIGRGSQLASPVVLRVSAGGREQALEPGEDGAGTLEAVEGGAVSRAKLAGGPATAEIETRYTDGRVDLGITYGAGGERLEFLELVVPLAGPVDTAIAGPVLDEAPRAYRSAEFLVPGGDGTVWANVGDNVPEEGREAPGVLPHLFVGSGDRGFTFLADPAGDWHVDPAEPTALIERASGTTTLRLRLVNHARAVPDGQKVQLSLRIHPATGGAGAARRRAWWAWPHGEAAPEAAPLTLEGAEAVKPGLLRADVAAALEPAESAGLLAGPAGGAALSEETGHAATYPANLFRYLAGTHTGLPFRFRPDARARTRSGADPGPDRLAIGRALVNNLGLDARGLADGVGAARLAGALHAFGYFADDGKTEWVPWWRSNAMVRYGEVFDADDPFSLHEENPVGAVRTAVYRRPRSEGEGVSALIIMVNEGPEAARAQLYVTDRERLFGGGNTLEDSEVMDRFDLSYVPADGDWRRRVLLAGRGSDVVLRDLENDGVLPRAAVDGNLATYGPQVFIPGHGFRIFYGHGGSGGREAEEN